jgi:hypothetical protein
MDRGQKKKKKKNKPVSGFIFLPQNSAGYDITQTDGRTDTFATYPDDFVSTIVPEMANTTRLFILPSARLFRSCLRKTSKVT